ncbi:uncharacterized protein K452DRAFT_235440 [Aplosporella prunicola CBS 121167]|uniref:ATP synthase assembly factor FMC1, mitochondrial n=1 Tax=Aplosporella prunicola CBS 121167 TaxID=1176127 RepID=A0A6A6B1C9_9PEZI|nr:uncharacterized protein K452DRAFT_235440 [Aplosporella prunicola CBS 121167]KAF2137626.1 hypothetical protein K452DRAFT_235440 [Aplosporella prunicola CBS 121167]
MATASPTAVRSIYRRLLRELPTRTPRPGSHVLSNPSPLQRHIRTTLGASATRTPSVDEAEQFVQYVRAQRMYVTLVERYNPGMNLTEEERIRLTARRVGMDLPVEEEK